MKKYLLKTKTGETINITKAYSIDEAEETFSVIKVLNIDELLEIFKVVEQV